MAGVHVSEGYRLSLSGLGSWKFVHKCDFAATLKSELSSQYRDACCPCARRKICVGLVLFQLRHVLELFSNSGLEYFIKQFNT